MVVFDAINEEMVITVNGILRMHSLVRAMAAIAVLAGVTLAAGGAQAQTDGLGEVTPAVCVTVDFSGARMIVGGPDRTAERAVDLPAGVVTIPSARGTDTYPSRGSVIQNSERYEVEFLGADGSVIATSAPTGDLPDEVVFGEWIGDLGSVTLSEPAVAVRAHHRPDLPGDNSPQSVMANELTLCSSGAPEVPVCGDPGVITDSDGNPCTSTPTVTSTTIESTTTTIESTTTTVESTTTSDDVAGPTTSTTAAPTTTAAAPTTTVATTTAPTSSPTTESEVVAGPTTRLADTGSDTAPLVALGSVIIAVGAALVLAQRRSLARR